MIRRLVSLSPRTACLGHDRWGRNHWALAPPADASSGPESRMVYVQPRIGRSVPGTLSAGGAGKAKSGDLERWHVFAGIESAESLAVALDARGWHERRLQASLWRLCDGR